MIRLNQSIIDYFFAIAKNINNINVRGDKKFCFIKNNNQLSCRIFIVTV